MQLQRMDACLDTLNDELCQVNNRVGCIAWCQAKIGGYTMPSTPLAFTVKSDDSNGADDVDDDNAIASNDEDDGDASSPSDDKMSTWHSYPLSLMTKRGRSFGYESSHT